MELIVPSVFLCRTLSYFEIFRYPSPTTPLCYVLTSPLVGEVACEQREQAGGLKKLRW
jgi:hypothetical protein